MNTKSLSVACVAIALMGIPVLAAGSSAPVEQSARIHQLVNVVGWNKPPMVLKMVVPKYPQELRKIGIQGVVTVEMMIDTTGRVIETELIYAPAPELGRLAVLAAKDWTFVPASEKGQPITTRVRVPFVFVMPELVAMGNR